MGNGGPLSFSSKRLGVISPLVGNARLTACNTGQKVMRLAF